MIQMLCENVVEVLESHQSDIWASHGLVMFTAFLALLKASLWLVAKDVVVYAGRCLQPTNVPL